MSHKNSRHRAAREAVFSLSACPAPLIGSGRLAREGSSQLAGNLVVSTWPTGLRWIHRSLREISTVSNKFPCITRSSQAGRPPVGCAGTSSSELRTAKLRSQLAELAKPEPKRRRRRRKFYFLLLALIWFHLSAGETCRSVSAIRRNTKTVRTQYLQNRGHRSSGACVTLASERGGCDVM